MSFERRFANGRGTSRRCRGERTGMTANRPHGSERTGALPIAAVPALVAILAATLASLPAGAQNDIDDDAVVIDGLMWAPASNAEDVPWGAAEQYCETLELAGHRDWRLPTLAELEGLHDPSAEANGFIMSPLEVPGCCLWSSTSLADLGAEEGGAAGGQRGAPSSYYWGFLFSGGIRYYSVERFPDGQALCVREAPYQ